MEWRSTLYISPAVASAICMATLAVYIWLRHGTKPQARTLAILMSAVAMWSLLYALELGCSGLSTKVFWAKLKYLGAVVVPPAWLAFSFEYTGREKWLRRRNLVLLAIVPVGTLLLIWTNGIHHLYWTNATLYKGNGFSTLSLPMGIGFWLWVAYSYSLVLLGTLVILEAFIRSHHLYRKQAGIMLIGSVIPWLGNIGFITGATPFPHLDLTPFAFTITNFVFVLGLIYFRLLDIAPVANDAVIASMRDAMMALDLENRLVDFNPAAGRLIGQSASEVIGRPVTQIWPHWPEDIARSYNEAENRREMALGDGTNQRIYEIHMSYQADAKGLPVSKVAILRDVTGRRHTEEALKTSMANYKAIFDTADDAILIHDIETGYILDVNRKMCEMCGYTEEEAKELSIEAISSGEPPYTQEEALSWMQNAARNGPQLFEWMAKDKGGRLFWVEVSLKRANIGGKDRLLAIVRDITERKRTQQMLQETDRRYRLLAQNVTDVIWTMDLQTLRFTYISPSVARLRGYRPEEAMAQPLHEVLTPDSLDIATKVLEKGLAEELAESGGVPHSRTLELQQLCKDGSTVWTEVTATFLYNSDGKPVELLGVTRDITERKRADEALRRNEEHFRSLIENALDAIGVVDFDGIILYESPSIERILGYKPDEVIGRSAIEAVHPDDRQQIIDVFNQIRNCHDMIRHEELRYQRKDGSWRIMEVLGKRLPYADSIVVNYRDITERKQAEEALQKSEKRYRLLAENVSDVIWTSDMNLNFTYCSPSITHFGGYSIEEAKLLRLEELLTPSSLEIARQLLLEELSTESKGPKDASRSRSVELEFYRKDGSTMWTEVKMTFLRDNDGRPVGILGVNRDITQQRQLQQQVLQAQKMQSIGTLAGGIAHDFNNLLAGILGYASLTKTKIPKGQQIYNYVDAIERSATRAAELTAQLLAFARGGKYEARVVDLNSIVNETIKLIGSTLEESIEIKLNLLDPLPTVEADTGQLQQVLMNLCVNARDAMPDGGKLAIETSTARHSRNQTILDHECHEIRRITRMSLNRR